MPEENAQLAQVLIKIGELSTQMAVVGTKQDALKETIDKLPLADFELRIRSLERFKWMMLGGSLAGGGAAGAIVAEAVRSLH